jgi:hypothetical protein
MAKLENDFTCSDEHVKEGAEIDDPIEIENDEGVVDC